MLQSGQYLENVVVDPHDVVGLAVKIVAPSMGTTTPLALTGRLVSIHSIFPHRLEVETKHNLNTLSSLHTLRHLLRTKPW